jgi:N-acetylneuraminate lyase
MKKIEGLVAAPFSPMLKNGSLNTDMIGPYYDFLAKNGIKGAFINGSTGEGMSLTKKERLTQLSLWAKCYKENKSVKILNHVGGTSYKECIEEAVLSKEAGVSAIALVAPYYFKPADVKQLAEYCTKVGESVPEIPVYLYHIPVLTGVNFPMVTFLAEIEKMLPNFAGIKFTHEDFMDYLSCMNYKDGKYDILWGRDECMLSALAAGAKGFVGSTYNYAAPLYHDLIRKFEENNLNKARKLQQASIDMISLLGKYGGMATGKSYMKFIGLDCGEFRSPVKNMTHEMYDKFMDDVKKLKMQEYFSVI